MKRKPPATYLSAHLPFPGSSSLRCGEEMGGDLKRSCGQRSPLTSSMLRGG